MVAAFVIESYQSLSSDPQAATVLLLAQISQQLAAVNGTISTQVPSEQPSSPSAGNVRVNALWVASLCISVTCALFSVMVQQWARRFQRICDRRPQGDQSSQAQARVRLHMLHAAPQVGNFIEMIGQVLHIAVFLFFAGLVEFFWPINSTVAKVALAMLVVLASLYATLTLVSVAFPASLFQTPLTKNIFGMYTLGITFLRALFASRGDGMYSLCRIFRQQAPSRMYEGSSITHLFGWLLRYGHLGIDQAVMLAINETPLGTIEVDAIVRLFQSHRAGFPEQLQRGAGIYFVGLCSILSTYFPPKGSPLSDSPVALELSKRLFESPAPDAWTQYFGSWESWLVHVGQTCTHSDYASTQFTIMCFRTHWFVLHSTAVTLPVNSGPIALPENEPSEYVTSQRPSAPLHITLQLLRRHFAVTVAMSARCFQARVAAELDEKWALPGTGASTFYSDVFWAFVAAPLALAPQIRGDPRTFGMPHNRAILIIIALAEDTLEAGRLRTQTDENVSVLRRGIVPVLKTIEAIQAKIFNRALGSPETVLVNMLEQYHHEFSASLVFDGSDIPGLVNERALADALKAILQRLGRLKSKGMHTQLPVIPVLTSDGLESAEKTV